MGVVCKPSENSALQLSSSFSCLWLEDSTGMRAIYQLLICTPRIFQIDDKDFPGNEVRDVLAVPDLRLR
jgi:hypothetical protein